MVRALLLLLCCRCRRSCFWCFCCSTTAVLTVGARRCCLAWRHAGARTLPDAPGNTSHVALLNAPDNTAMKAAYASPVAPARPAPLGPATWLLASDHMDITRALCHCAHCAARGVGAPLVLLADLFKLLPFIGREQNKDVPQVVELLSALRTLWFEWAEEYHFDGIFSTEDVSAIRKLNRCAAGTLLFGSNREGAVI